MAPSFVTRLRTKARHGLLVQEILNRLGRLGVWCSPYIVYREGLAEERGEESPYRFRRLDAQDLPELSRLTSHRHPDAVYRQRFEAGGIAAGAFDGARLIACTWAEVQAFPGLGSAQPIRPLKFDEAYLHDAFTDGDYRGQSIILHLRSYLYELLREGGRRRFYSVSVYFNRSARRFKEKLGAKEVEVRLSVNLFRRFHQDFRLRRVDH